MTVWDEILKRPYGALAALCLAVFLQGFFTLPAIDRDEARFAQASKQMIETGDLVDIRFQGEPRHKKPAGIYWLQAASAALFSPAPHDAIWPYRLPSLLGALAAVWLTFWAGRPLVGDRAALIGAALLGASLMLGVEAKLAKTDAVLLASVVAAQGALARIALGPRDRPGPWPLTVLFWAALGAGTLVKGPIPLLVAGLTLLAWMIVRRDGRLLLRLRPVSGLAVLALTVLPWGLAAMHATGGEFFRTAVAGDLLPKLKGGQESHGAPPGTYFILSALTFWPGSLALPAALSDAIRRRAEPAIIFLLAWIVPAWIMFEAVPTKLPHYVLPLYPALALLCGGAIDAALRGRRTALQGPLGRIGLALWAAVALALAGLVASLPPALTHAVSITGIVLGLLILAATGLVLSASWRKDWARAAGLAVLASVLAQAATFTAVAPGLSPLWLSTRIVAALPRTASGERPPLVASGYAEPSLVFAAGTNTLLTSPEEAAAFLQRHPSGVAAIATRQRPAFLTALASSRLSPETLASVSGINYSTGKALTLTLFRAHPLEPIP